MPASEAHHHAGPGGMLDHGLEVVAHALTTRRGHLLPPGANPERLAREQDLWTYAVFSAALLHDIGKPVVDQCVTLFDAKLHPFGNWDPWQGPMVERGVWYRVDFVRKRNHGLHERVAPLLSRMILPSVGVSWLASNPKVLTQWIAAINGDTDEPGILGEIILRADGESVARNLGAGNHVQLPSARIKPLHERLLIGLRYLLDQGALPLNVNGAAGWAYRDDLWLVVKRCLDSLREHLQTEGQPGIPSRNDRLMDELQQNAILIPNGDKAVWKMRVHAPDWPKAHDLTLLRFSIRKIWSNPEAQPQAFAGQITPIETQELKTEAAKVHPPIDSLAADANLLVDQNTSEGDHIASQSRMFNEIPSSNIATASGSGLLTKPSTVTPANKPVSDLDEPNEHFDNDAGMLFLTWLREGLGSGQLAVNAVNARVHVVKEGLLLVSPGIFKDYDRKQWAHVQKRFQKLKLNLRTESGENIHTYVAQGQRKRSLIKGFLISEPEKTLPGLKLSQPNPYLSLLK